MPQPASGSNDLVTRKSLPRPLATPRTPAQAAVGEPTSPKQSDTSQSQTPTSPITESPPDKRSTAQSSQQNPLPTPEDNAPQTPENQQHETAPQSEPQLALSPPTTTQSSPPSKEHSDPNPSLSTIPPSTTFDPTPTTIQPVEDSVASSEVVETPTAIDPTPPASSAASKSSETEAPKLPLDAAAGANPTAPNTPPAVTSGASSSVEASMYESPSPPSTASSPEYTTGYGTISRRRRSPENDGAQQGGTEGAVTGGNGMVTIEDERLRSISPIRREANAPYSDLPETTTADGGWQGTSFVPVLADETSALIRGDVGSMNGNEAILTQSRADLEQARIASSREFNRRERLDGMTDRYVLGCSVIVMCSVVFVIVVSGMTTLLANRNFPQLEVYSDWPNGGIIPLKYGCLASDGEPVSIPLRWRNVPKQATNLAVLLAHPGAIGEKGHDPVHWFVTNIPVDPKTDECTSPTSSEDQYCMLPANASGNPELMPAGAKEHGNEFSKEGKYWPPCAHNGTSRYVIHVYAIEAPARIDDFYEANKIMSRFAGVPVARITGLYGKPAPLVVQDDTHGDKAKGGKHDDHANNKPVDAHDPAPAPAPAPDHASHGGH